MTSHNWQKQTEHAAAAHDYFWSNTVSPRGNRLVLTNGAQGRLVTVELYVKWHELYLLTRIHDELIIEPVALFHPEHEAIAARLGVSAACDHVPNPKVIQTWCEAKGYELDTLAHELMAGRWTLEVLER